MKSTWSRKKSVCTIVSHTPYCQNKDGLNVGLGPTVDEIDHLATLFTKVFHCAPVHNEVPPPSYLAHRKNNIYLIPLKPAGGDTLREKAQHLFFFSFHLKQIKSCLKESDWLHFRAPTGIGVFFLPWVFFFWKRGVWIKYAGSWEDRSAPLSYKFQRWFLKRFPKRVKISMNGVFDDLQGNFLNFINPCLDKNILQRAADTANKKDFNGKLNLLFVGRLERAKGLDDLLFLIEKMGSIDKINSLTIVGESKTLPKYKNWAEKLPVKVIITGPLSREDVFRYYAMSHILILLSKTEGFPKVIMEAGAFGCVSIVSDLPQIRNLIKHGHNGFIFRSNPGIKDHQKFKAILDDTKILNFCSKNININAKHFTFEKYISTVENAILRQAHSQ